MEWSGLSRTPTRYVDATVMVKKDVLPEAPPKKTSDQLSKPIRMKPLHLCTKPVSGPLCFGASLALALAVGVLAIIRIEISSNSRFSLAVLSYLCIKIPAKCGRNIGLY